MEKDDDHGVSKERYQVMDIMLREKGLNLQEILAYHKATHEYSMGGIKALLIINVGAFTVLPVYWGLIEVDFLENNLNIDFIIASFLFGIICAMIALLSGFFTESERHGMSFYQAECNILGSLLSHFPERYDQSSRKEASEMLGKMRKVIEKKERYGNRARKIGIFFALLSLFSFIFGAMNSFGVLKSSMVQTITVKNEQIMMNGS